MVAEKEIDIKKDWRLIEKNLSLSFWEGREILKLRIGKDELSFRLHLYKNRVMYLLFLNGYLYTGREDGKEKIQYMNEYTKYVIPAKEREKAKKRYIKIFGKKKGIEEFEKSYWNNTITVCDIMFTSKLRIKKMLERQTEKIFLIEEG